MQVHLDSNGSITSTVSANTTAGISIVKFTGTAANATVGHGLGVAPKVIITKSRVNAENWGFYHEYLGNTRQLTLNTTGAQTGQSSAYYNNTSPTSTVFSVGTADSTNDNQNMIAYCFAEKKGYLVSLETTQEMVMLQMEHLFIQDLNQLSF